MNWDLVTVLTVITGICGIAAALIPSLDVKSRLWFAAGGASYVVYGIYGASMTSGTYVYSVWIFIMPVVALIYLAAHLMNRSTPTDAGARTHSPPTRSQVSGQPGSQHTPRPAPVAVGADGTCPGCNKSVAPAARSMHPRFCTAAQ